MVTIGSQASGDTGLKICTSGLTAALTVEECRLIDPLRPALQRAQRVGRRRFGGLGRVDDDDLCPARAQLLEECLLVAVAELRAQLRARVAVLRLFEEATGAQEVELGRVLTTEVSVQGRW